MGGQRYSYRWTDMREAEDSGLVDSIIIWTISLTE